MACTALFSQSIFLKRWKFRIQWNGFSNVAAKYPFRRMEIRWLGQLVSQCCDGWPRRAGVEGCLRAVPVAPSPVAALLYVGEHIVCPSIMTSFVSAMDSGCYTCLRNNVSFSKLRNIGANKSLLFKKGRNTFLKLGSSFCSYFLQRVVTPQKIGMAFCPRTSKILPLPLLHCFFSSYGWKGLG